MRGLKLRLFWPLFVVLVLAGCRQGGGLLGLGPATPKPTPKPTSPGANKIAYLDNDGSFWLVSPDRKERRLLFYDSQLAGKTDLHFDWSPDASKIVMDGLRLVDLKTGEIKHLPKGETPKWSPKGDQILITGTGFDSDNLYLMKADGSDSKLIDKNVILDWGVNHSRNWSPKGDRFVYTKIIGDDPTGSQTYEIWVADAEGKNRHRLFDPERFGMTDLRYPTWSPTGDWIAFTYRSVVNPASNLVDNIALIDPSTRDLRILSRFDSSLQSPIFPTWSPNGQRLSWLVVSTDKSFGGVWTADIAGFKPSYVFPSTPLYPIRGAPPIWTPDGANVIVSVGGFDHPISKITDGDLTTTWRAAGRGQHHCTLTGEEPLYITEVEVSLPEAPDVDTTWGMNFDRERVSAVNLPANTARVIQFSFSPRFASRVRIQLLKGNYIASISEVSIIGSRFPGAVVTDIAPEMGVECYSGDVNLEDTPVSRSGIYLVPVGSSKKPRLLFTETRSISYAPV